PVRRPGVMRLWSWQAVAHGADSVLFFQMRASRGACEMTHGAVLDHSGRLDTRAFREVAGLGAELERLGDLVPGCRPPAGAALAGVGAVWDAGAQLDVVPVTADLSGYDVVAAPLLHMVKGDLPARLRGVAVRGGTVLTGYLSGRVDEDDRRFLADVPGPLAGLAGVRVAETDAAEPAVGNPVAFDGGPVVDGRMVFEVLVPEGAEVMARYRADFYAEAPAVTRHRVRAADGGEGHVWYVGTQLDQPGVTHVVRRALARH